MGAFDGLIPSWANGGWSKSYDEPKPAPATKAQIEFWWEFSNTPFTYPWGRKELNISFIGPFSLEQRSQIKPFGRFK